MKIELKKTIFEYINSTNGNCFTKEMRDILKAYKNSGGEKEVVIELLNELKAANPNNLVIECGADDILDIVTGLCSLEMRVWMST